jgi:acyl-CoA dehydrogenase
MAEAASELAVTEAALAAALEAESQGRGRTLLWRSAKAQAGHAATVIASSAHQVLGAIGFTEEHELQHFTRRLWQWRDEWGRQADCQLAIGGEACADPAGLWLHICDQERDCA